MLSASSSDPQATKACRKFPAPIRVTVSTLPFTENSVISCSLTSLSSNGVSTVYTEGVCHAIGACKHIMSLRCEHGVPEEPVLKPFTYNDFDWGNRSPVTEVVTRMTEDPRATVRLQVIARPQFRSATKTYPQSPCCRRD